MLIRFPRFAGCYSRKELIWITSLRIFVLFNICFNFLWTKYVHSTDTFSHTFTHIFLITTVNLPNLLLRIFSNSHAIKALCISSTMKYCSNTFKGKDRFEIVVLVVMVDNEQNHRYRIPGPQIIFSPPFILFLAQIFHPLPTSERMHPFYYVLSPGTEKQRFSFFSYHLQWVCL